MQFQSLKIDISGQEETQNPYFIALLFNYRTQSINICREINSLRLYFCSGGSSFGNEGMEAGRIQLVREMNMRMGLRESSGESKRETKPAGGWHTKIAPRKRKVGLEGKRLQSEATPCWKSDADGAVRLGQDGRERRERRRHERAYQAG